jgi:zinc/manganese transport system substrate-binding protein
MLDFEGSRAEGGIRFENQYHFGVLVRVRVSVMLLAVVLVGCGHASPRFARDATTPLIVATTTQVADFAHVIGGSDVQIYAVLAPGVDPHDYQPTAADLHAMSRAAVIVTNGVGLEPWFTQARAATDPKGTVVIASDGIILRGRDPHLWQDPTRAEHMVETIERAMAAALPAQADRFSTNLAAYRSELHRLDADISTGLATVTDRKVVTNHDAFAYFIEHFRLDYVGSVIPGFDTSTELSTADVRKLISRIRATRTRAVFSEASLPTKAAAAIAEQAGVRVVMGPAALYGDSLGPVGSGADTYLGMMRHNATTIIAALGGNTEALAA